MRKANAHDKRQDEELAAVLSKTEIMVLNFHQSSGLSQRRGQALLDVLRHPEFNIKDVQSTTIVQLLLRLEQPFKECALCTVHLQLMEARRRKSETGFCERLLGGVQRNYSRSTVAGAFRPRVSP